MIITNVGGIWKNNKGNTLENILEEHGVDVEQVQTFLNTNEFLIRTKYNSVIKIERRGENEISFTPYYSDKDNSLKFIYLDHRLHALSDRAEGFLNHRTGFLNLHKLKVENLDYYIETRDNGLAVVGLINRVDSSEFLNIYDFNNHVSLISMTAEADLLGRPNYMSVLRCYDDISLAEMKTILSDTKRFMRDLRIYHTGIYEFTVLSKFSINHLMVSSVIAELRTSPITNYEEEYLRNLRKNLFKEIENNRDAEEENILRGYFKALHNKTDETVEHSERMRRIATILGEELLITDKEFERLLKMSMIHDVGKLAIEGKIINKPGKLTEEEFQIMKKHTILGFEMMEGIGSYADSRDVCLYHHERWDGRGYLSKLKGAETPLLIRIVTLADSIDAMASKRIYKESFSFDYIKDEIERLQGLQFCPQVSRVCLNIFETIKSIY